MEIHINIDKHNIIQSMEGKINRLLRVEAWGELNMHTENKSGNRFIYFRAVNVFCSDDADTPKPKAGFLSRRCCVNIWSKRALNFFAFSKRNLLLLFNQETTGNPCR